MTPDASAIPDGADFLCVWEEVSGPVEGIDLIEGKLVMTVARETVVVPANALNREVIESHWPELEGEYVSIIRTESPADPYRMSVGRDTTLGQSVSTANGE